MVQSQRCVFGGRLLLVGVVVELYPSFSEPGVQADLVASPRVWGGSRVRWFGLWL